jgi:hypothetical protein
VASELERAAESSGGAARVIGGGFASEPEIAVSTDGQKIVVGQQFNFVTSNDGGLTFPTAGPFPSSDGGDSSLAYGNSGNFYEGTIFGTSSALNVSTDGGKTFTFRAKAFTCPTTGANQCGFTRGNPPAPFPDQEHITADRFNASANGGDQVYFAWRQGNGNISVACSSDSGQNFGAPIFAPGDYPRITVGQDGFVYVVYVSGGNVTLNKYSSCQAGLAVQTGFPVTIATSIGVICPVPGLDRCNSGNLLSSPTVAVDDTNSNHIYVAYAQSSGGGESVVLRDSTDGGATWLLELSRFIILNASITARRFMPWLCTTGGFANVTWYDRRAATSTRNDLTDYYGANASVTGSGVLSAGTEFQLNAVGSADAQCLAGKAVGSPQSWPSGSRAPGDSTSCSEQPELGGKCRHLPPNATDSSQACNFSAVVNNCPITETCQTGSGIPKYGDYNGNACAAGKLYAVWASATPPPGLAASGNVDLYFASVLGQPPPLCPTEVRANTNLNQSTTTFKWSTPPNVDHLIIKRNGVALPSGLLVFADGRSILPPTTTSVTVPFDQDYLATYNICTVARDAQSCCAAPVTPTRTLCVEVAKCRVHGREVIPTDTDDPTTWCSDAGGKIDHFLQCSTSGDGTTTTRTP